SLRVCELRGNARTPELLSGGPAVLSRTDGEANGRYVSICAFVARRLALSPRRISADRSRETPPDCALRGGLLGDLRRPAVDRSGADVSRARSHRERSNVIRRVHGTDALAGATGRAVPV